MAYTSVYNGIIFIEGEEPGARILGTVEFQKEGFYNQQLKDLTMVKNQLANKAISMGGNAIKNFTYGQKSTSWFRSLLLSYDDNINWYGSGVVISLSPERREELLSVKP